MMRTAFVLLLVCGLANAAPLPEQNIRNMVAQSDQVMKAGVCAVAADTRRYPGQKITVLLGDGPHEIQRDAYNWIREPGYTRNKRTGRFLMSERIEQACRKDDRDERCIAARAYWSQQPINVHPPGPGVKLAPPR